MSTLSISPQVSTQLLELWAQVRGFSAQVCHLQAPVGTGSKHVLNHFQREVAGECITWHIRFRENLYGWEILPVLTDGLWKTIRHSANMVQMVRGCLEMDLGDERLNGILRSMSESLQFSHDNDNAQLRLPSDNPILGLVLMARAIMKEVPLLIIVENVQFCHSFIPLVFLLAAMQDAQQTRTLVVLQSSVLDDGSVSSFPIPAQALLSTLRGMSMGLETWDKAAIETFLAARSFSDLSSEDILAWSEGRQECVAEMLSWFSEDPSATQAISAKQLLFIQTDEPEKTEQCIRIASLLGWRFSVQKVAELLGFDVDEVKSLLRTQEHMIELEEENATFRYVLHQMRLFEDTVRQLPSVAGQVSDTVYSTFGRTEPELLLQSAKIYNRLERHAEAQEALALMWDLDADVLYLAMLEVLIRWGISFDTVVMEPLWIRASRHQFASNPEVALQFQQRALKWAADNSSAKAAIEIYRQGARSLNKQGQITEAEQQFKAALQVAIQEGMAFLQVDIRIDMVEFYVGNGEVRRASEQLILLDEQSFTVVQRIRLLGVHARLAQTESEHLKAAGLFLEGRKLALSVYKWGLATDLALLGIEAIFDAGEMERGSELLTQLKAEAEEHDRMEMWDVLHKRAV